MAVTRLRPSSRQQKARRVGHPKLDVVAGKAGPPAGREPPRLSNQPLGGGPGLPCFLPDKGDKPGNGGNCSQLLVV